MRLVISKVIAYEYNQQKYPSGKIEGLCKAESQQTQPAEWWAARTPSPTTAAVLLPQTPWLLFTGWFAQFSFSSWFQQIGMKIQQASHSKSLCLHCPLQP